MTPDQYDLRFLHPDGIGSEKRMRALRPDVVDALVKSIRQAGMRILQPIIVAPRPKGTGRAYRLIAGQHRLEAARRLKMQWVPAYVLEGMSDNALWLVEVEENLSRGDLTPAERSEHMAARTALLKALKTGQESSAPNMAQISKRGRLGEGRPRGGNREAARDMGVSEQAVRRSARIAALPPEVKDIARTSGMSQAALLRVASRPPEEQAQAAREEARKATTPHHPPKAQPVPGDGLPAEVLTFQGWVERYGWRAVNKGIVQAVWRRTYPKGRVVLNTGHGPKATT